MQISQRIAPCLWFDDQAEEAATFYVSIFRNSRIVSVARYSKAGQETHKRPKKIDIGEIERAAAGEPVTR